MNIWYLSAYDQPKGQSPRTYIFSRELAKRGHRVTMFTNSYCHFTHAERLDPHEKWRIVEIDGIRVVWLRTIHYTGNGIGRGMNMVSNAWRAFQAARTFSDVPDVVIGPSVPLLCGWAAMKLAQRNGAAFVFEVRDVWPFALAADGGISKNGPVYLAFRYIEKLLYRKAQRISAVLPFIFDHVSRSGGDPKKVAWIPNGVDFERFDGFEAYDGGKDLPLVAMYVGGFGASQDVASIIRAAGILKEKGNDKYRFVLAGKGVTRPDCEREAASLGLKNVEFRDPVPKKDVPRLQMEADLLIAALIGTASFSFGMNSNKIYDYLASGRPMIFSGRTPNDPAASSGAGFSVPPQDPDALAGALERFLERRPEERIEMGKRGRRYVERENDIPKLVERMESLLS
ncbi:MAG: glycosyltransferase family 4 protein, partial [Deltaproteobacteria bacterium]|nr:glycosyltransferase family 4 protein [Deltaproteobacteria bacterium]